MAHSHFEDSRHNSRSDVSKTGHSAAIASAYRSALKRATDRADFSPVVELMKDGKLTEEGIRRGIRLP